MMRGIAAIVLVALVALPYSAWGEGGGPEPAQNPVVRIGFQDQMKTRNILTDIAWNDPYTIAVLARVYDTPVQRDSVSDAVFPRLAVGMDVNGDGVLDPAEVGDFTVPPTAPAITVFYDFRNARFHDGTPVTVMDVLFSYHVLALRPKLWAPLWVLMDGGGGPGSNASTDRWLWVVAVADGDTNASTAALRFTPQFPYAPFPFATLGIPVLPRHLWEGTGGGRHADFGLAVYPEGHPRQGQGIPVTETAYTPYSVAAAADWQMTDADVVGSGHFRFVTWSIGMFAQLDANLDYAFGRPKVGSLVFRIYRVTQLAVLALHSGEIDYYFNAVPAEFIPDLRNDPNIDLLTSPSLFPVTMTFNMRRLPFGYELYPPTDARVDDVGLPFRKAFAHLIDKATMVRVLLQDQGTVAGSMVAPTNDGWYNGTLPDYDYDPAEAALILDNAGWVDSDSDGWREFPRLGDAQFEILTPQADYDPIRASAGAMIAAAARSIGVNVVSKPTAFGAIIQAIDARDFDVTILSNPEVHVVDPWTLWRGDPDYLFDLLHSANQAAGRNFVGFWDTPFDARAEAARAAPDPVTRTAEVRWVQGILAERSPALPMFYRNHTWGYRADRYQGWRVIGSTPFNYWSLQDLQAAPNEGPVITLVSPADGALFPPGVPIDLEVTDTDLVRVDVTLFGSYTIGLSPPYDIDTSTWEDGAQTILVRATDSSGNYTDASFEFTVDGTPPSVVLESPTDGALVPGGTVVNLSVSDAHLFSVELAVDGGSYQAFDAPYDVPMAGIADGPHTFRVRATDRAGNVASPTFSFTLDATRPEVSEREPEGLAPSLPSDVRVTFSESVNRTSVEAAFSMTDGVRIWTAADGTFFWSADRTSFTFAPDGPLAEGREHHVTLMGTVTDDAGNEMGQDVTWAFSTQAPGGADRDIWVYATGLVAAIAAVLGLLLLVVVLRRKKQGGPTAKGKQ